MSTEFGRGEPTIVVTGMSGLALRARHTIGIVTNTVSSLVKFKYTHIRNLLFLSAMSVGKPHQIYILGPN